MMYAAGLGTEQDMVKAYRWISKAADQGVPRSAGAKAHLEASLTPTQLNLVRVGEEEDYDISGPNIAIPEFNYFPETTDE